jgi:dTDP-4-amino-4,6-dideoxygalactose transaminase/lipopolysaccharide/colanic/teichoic acid biosynthesis glycosyltransferase
MDFLLKRLFDVAVALALLLALAPLLLVIAILVQIRLGSPIFFRQRRIGRKNKPFALIKFRTMTNKRDAMGDLLPDAQRLTPFGQWLRATSIDELPELWNILIGKMSLVGPRPLLPEYLPFYTSEELRRHHMRPGITGLAQVSGRNSIGWDTRLAFDISYVDTFHFWLDIKILWRTAWVVMKRDGISAAGEATMGRLDVERSHKVAKSPRIQSRIFLSPPHMSGTEHGYVTEAFGSNYVAPVGPMVDAFEHAFAEAVGIPHCLALSSGTAAIHLAMIGAGVGAGDTVIASSLTFIGSVSPILYQGATPIFIDADPAHWTMDVGLLEEALATAKKNGKLPKAVIPTDLYGQSCDASVIKSLCDDYGVALIIDSAEAVGATYHGQHAGYFSKAAAYSFNGNKIITTSGGGMLASHDKSFIDHARFLSQQARDAAPHYEHSTYGYNYRMSNIVAAIGRGQLEVLGARVTRRREVFDYYVEHLGKLPGIAFMPEAAYGRSNRWLSTITVNAEVFGNDREAIRRALESENIESRPIWKPMHMQPVFKDTPMVGGAVSERLFRDGLCLPSGSQLTEAELERIVNIVTSCKRP